MIKTDGQRESLQKGDIVEMIGNLSDDLKSMTKPRLGLVENVNGAYVLVKPEGKTYSVDFLENEVKFHRRPESAGRKILEEKFTGNNYLERVLSDKCPEHDAVHIDGKEELFISEYHAWKAVQIERDYQKSVASQQLTQSNIERDERIRELQAENEKLKATIKSLIERDEDYGA